MKKIKTALITGAANRIGKAIATELARQGYQIAVHYNQSEKQATETVNEIKQKGGEAKQFQANLTDQKQTEKLIETVNRNLGAVDLLVNNASIFEDDNLNEFDSTKWDCHFSLHLKAPMILSGLFASQLPPDSDGLIVNIIDQRVLRITPRHFSYTLSKHALWTATRMSAQCLAPRIRVNALAPGPTLPAPRQSQTDFDAQVKSTLLGRSAKPEDFAKAILYFVDNPSITGQILALDGGQHLAWETTDLKLPE